MWAVDSRTGYNGRLATQHSAPPSLATVALASLKVVIDFEARLRSPDWVERRAAAADVGGMRLCGEAVALFAVLAKLAKGDEEPRVRRKCVMVLASWGELAQDYVEDVARVLANDDDAAVRWEAAIALAKLVGPHALHTAQSAAGRSSKDELAAVDEATAVEPAVEPAVEAPAGDASRAEREKLLADVTAAAAGVAVRALRYAEGADAAADVRSKAADVLRRAAYDHAAMTRTARSDAQPGASPAKDVDALRREKLLADEDPLVSLLDRPAQRRYRRLAPAEKSKSLRVTAYVAAAGGANAAFVRRMLEKEPTMLFAVDNLAAPKYTLLHSAAAAGNSGVVEALLDAGADALARDGEGSAALALACRWGHEAAAAALLADFQCQKAIHVLDKVKKTPLHEAARYGHVGCARGLVYAGADPYLADAGFGAQQPSTPADTATSFGFFDFAAQLVEAERRWFKTVRKLVKLTMKRAAPPPRTKDAAAPPRKGTLRPTKTLPTVRRSKQALPRPRPPSPPSPPSSPPACGGSLFERLPAVLLSAILVYLRPPSVIEEAPPAVRPEARPASPPQPASLAQPAPEAQPAPPPTRTFPHPC
ncbi:hypothetical protein M885DRAFT_620375 [Pelagophyceae sp. CCMP2097]|nr:hypothetical protein M885DRAFT_620375 [Pelagophyceae sp. CCMP2097]